MNFVDCVNCTVDKDASWAENKDTANKAPAIGKTDLCCSLIEFFSLLHTYLCSSSILTLKRHKLAIKTG